MGDRKKMTIDELELLVNAMRREQVIDPVRISLAGESTFYRRSSASVEFSCHVYADTRDADRIWATISGRDYECLRPMFLSFKKRKKYDAVLRTIAKIRNGKDDPEFASIENIICKCVPSAMDIIAERALIEDMTSE